MNWQTSKPPIFAPSFLCTKFRIQTCEHLRSNKVLVQQDHALNASTNESNLFKLTHCLFHITLGNLHKQLAFRLSRSTIKIKWSLQEILSYKVAVLKTPGRALLGVWLPRFGFTFAKGKCREGTLIALSL